MKYFQLRKIANRTKCNTFFDIQSDVMWCDVMWCDVLCCDVMWCVVMLCDVMWCDVMWCVVLWCDVMWCDVMWCDVMCCVVMWCDGMRCDVMCCDVMWCDLVVSMLMLLIPTSILHVFGSRLNLVVGCDMVLHRNYKIICWAQWFKIYGDFFFERK